MIKFMSGGLLALIAVFAGALATNMVITIVGVLIGFILMLAGLYWMRQRR